MKKYEYRLEFLEFDGSDRSLPGRMRNDLGPGERVIKTFGVPEQVTGRRGGYPDWYLSVLIEKEVNCFVIRAHDQEELTELLNGERNGQ